MDAGSLQSECELVVGPVEKEVTDCERSIETSRDALWQDVFPPNGLQLLSAGTVDIPIPPVVLLWLSAEPTGLILLTPGLKL